MVTVQVWRDSMNREQPNLLYRHLYISYLHIDIKPKICLLLSVANSIRGGTTQDFRHYFNYFKLFVGFIFMDFFLLKLKSIFINVYDVAF